MARKSPSSKSANTASKRMQRSNTQSQFHNKILLSLAGDGCAALFSKLEFVSLPLHTVLNETGEQIKYAYFLNDGLASVLSIMSDGKTVEVGLCGSEGVVGIPLASGFRSSHARIIMQVAGSGFRVTPEDFGRALQDCPKFSEAVHRFAQELALQSAQVAACNRLHEVDERLARWLLMSQDRLGGDDVPLTQDYLSHMLGTRRASVTVAAGILQKAGLIEYSRGVVNIVDRAKLESAACECYGLMTDQIAKWQSEIG